MFRTFRHRLLFWFLVFIGSSLLVVALSFGYINKREEIFRNAERIDQSYVLLLKSVKAQKDFFSYETKSVNYFETYKSAYLNLYRTLLDSTLNLLDEMSLPEGSELAISINSQQGAIEETDSLFNQLVFKVQERGFKDHSLEGAMREDVHWLENDRSLPVEDILSLRRHEKDYIIRNEKQYVDKFNLEIEALKRKIAQSPSILNQNQEVLQRLDGYQLKFNRLVELDQLVGIKDNTGLKRLLDDQIAALETSFSGLVKDTKVWAKQEFDRLTLYFGVTVVLLIIISILISWLIARRITRPLTDLTNHITRFVESNFTLETEHPVISSKDEVGSLTQNFSIMKDEVISTMKFFKQKVEERTAELAEANRRLIRLSEANSRFVPNEFLEKLGKKSIEEIELGDHVEQEMTVVFSDIREFTKLSEELNPQENFDFLNEYLKGIVPRIKEHGGFIDKFVGDSVMALFAGSPDGAIRATLDFEKFLAEFNKELIDRKKNPIQIGSGIHTGDLILGTIGHDHRLETTVISDVVNTASRVEGLTKYYKAKAIFTESTLKNINDKSFHYRFLDKVRVKGKSKTISIYELLDPSEVKKIQSLEVYNKGLKKLKSDNIHDAMKIFKQLGEDNPDDGAVEILLEKCEQHLQSDNEKWSGITHMINK